MKADYFASQAGFRNWLKKNHSSEDEVWVGFYKRASGVPSITYSEALDEALCFGWIDGVRKSLDADRYVIRFTPRKSDSHWSAVNVAKARALMEAGRMHASGSKAFESRKHEQKVKYSEARKAARLDPAYEKTLKANEKAWAYLQSRPPSYRQAAVFWIMYAKREETRLKRLAILITFCKAGKVIPPFAPIAKSLKELKETKK